MRLEDLTIYITCIDIELFESLKEEFDGIDNVEIFNEEFTSFMEDHDEVDTIVSPGNSYGYMTGGYDAAISDYLGDDFQEKIQRIIKKKYYGEQPVASSFITKVNDDLDFIHTPTLRVPSVIDDYDIVYQCMRTTLMCALNFEKSCVLIPPFGAGVGKVPSDIVSKKMREAYDQIKTRRGHSYF